MEINDQLAGEQAPLGHAAEAPAFVETERPGNEAFEGLGGLGGEFSSINSLLEFFVHPSFLR